jgi:hypothetical protein
LEEKRAASGHGMRMHKEAHSIAISCHSYAYSAHESLPHVSFLIVTLPCVCDNFIHPHPPALHPRVRSAKPRRAQGSKRLHTPSATHLLPPLAHYAHAQPHHHLPTSVTQTWPPRHTPTPTPKHVGACGWRVGACPMLCMSDTTPPHITLPEGTPADKELAEVLHARGLLDQAVHLV